MIDGWDGRTDGWMALGSSYLTSQPSASRQPPIPLSTPQSSSSHIPFPHNPFSNLSNLSKWMLSFFPTMDKPLSLCLTPSTMVSFLPLLLPLPLALLVSQWASRFHSPTDRILNSQRSQAPIETSRSLSGAKRPISHRILGLLLVVT